MSTPRRLNYAHVMVVIANGRRWAKEHDKDEGFLILLAIRIEGDTLCRNGISQQWEKVNFAVS